jgi:hypothetical protein
VDVSGKSDADNQSAFVGFGVDFRARSPELITGPQRSANSEPNNARRVSRSHSNQMESHVQELAMLD